MVVKHVFRAVTRSADRGDLYSLKVGSPDLLEREKRTPDLSLMALKINLRRPDSLFLKEQANCADCSNIWRRDYFNS